MNPRPKSRPAAVRPRQVVSEEVMASLLGLIQRKFYAGHAVQFSKDRKPLLRWVIFWPAREFFKPKAVTIPNPRYLEILQKIIIEAAMHQAGPIRYLPAYLGKAVQSHFAVHGDAIYEEAKSVRSLADNALALLGKMPVKIEDDAVERFTAADRLLAVSKTNLKTARIQRLDSEPKQPSLFEL
jgi:hypothetical protein